MKLHSSLWAWRLRNIKDLFFVPSQLQMNIFIPSFLNLLIFSLASSSLFCFAFRLKSLCCRSRLADDASFFSSETHLHLGILVQILLSHQRPSVFPFKAKSIPGHSRSSGTNCWQQTKLFVSLNSEVSGLEAWFFIPRTNKLISLKASLTDMAAVNQKASLTFQSAADQIRQRWQYRDGCLLSDVLGGQ